MKHHLRVRPVVYQRLQFYNPFTKPLPRQLGGVWHARHIIIIIMVSLLRLHLPWFSGAQLDQLPLFNYLRAH